MSELGLEPFNQNDPTYRSLRNHLQNLVATATNNPFEKVARFPGTMPLTLSRRHFGVVAHGDYVALEKSDGVRYMLLAMTNFVVLIDRRMNIYVVEPNPTILDKGTNAGGFGEPQDNTLLDGELTFNLMTNQWDYLIYDAIAINGDLSVAALSFRQRMHMAEMYVAGPRLWASFTSGLLRLRIKDYYEKKNIHKLFSKIRKDPKGHYIYINNDRRDGVLCNQNDGVILSPVGMSYQIKSCPALLKWKPPHLNSVDFKLQLEQTHDPKRNEPTVKGFIAYQGDQRAPVRFREVYFPRKRRRLFLQNFDKFNNSIVELAYDKGRGDWQYIRQREDKKNANYSNTVIDTLETIAESMERDELVRFLQKTSNPPTKGDEEIIKAVTQNVEHCTFRDDLFDDSNEDYLISTAISIVPVPKNVQVLPPRRSNRRRQQGEGQSRTANGDGREENSVENTHESRAAFQYDDDV